MPLLDRHALHQELVHLHAKYLVRTCLTSYFGNPWFLLGVLMPSIAIGTTLAAHKLDRHGIWPSEPDLVLAATVLLIGIISITLLSGLFLYTQWRAVNMISTRGGEGACRICSTTQCLLDAGTQLVASTPPHAALMARRDERVAVATMLFSPSTRSSSSLLDAVESEANNRKSTSPRLDLALPLAIYPRAFQASLVSLLHARGYHVVHANREPSQRLLGINIPSPWRTCCKKT